MKYKWIVLKYDVYPYILICERCNGQQVMPKGTMRMSIFLAIGDAFTNSHKDCKPKSK